MRAIQINRFGGPEVLELSELPDPVAGPGEVVVEVARAGMNFADTHQRRDDYLAKATLPLIPGAEVAGRTADGRRVAAILMSGGYAERVAVHQAGLIEIPDPVGDDQAAALLLQGLTASALLRQCARIAPGESVLVQAAGGGTGTLAVQLAKQFGAGRVVAMASSEQKRALAARLGADACVDSRLAGDELASALSEANQGRKLDVVLEMSGGETFDVCLEALAPFGRLVSFGIASRQPNQVQTQDLMRTSRAVVGFWLVHLLGRPEVAAAAIAELFESVASGRLEVVIGGVYPLAQAGEAQIALGERRTQGKLLLDPSS